MVDRSNIQDIYSVLKDEFTWMLEDMEQQRGLIKNKMLNLYKEDQFEEAEELKQQYINIKELMDKIEDMRREYISLFQEDDAEEENTYVKDLADWTDIAPDEIKLFDKIHSVRKWREILTIIIEELIKMKPKYIEKIDKIDDFKGRTRLYFSYDEQQINIDLYSKASNGLYYIVNNNANSTMLLCRKILQMAGYEESALQVLKYHSSTGGSLKSNDSVQVSDDMIKLRPQYASIKIGKQLFIDIVTSILNRKEVYGKEYIVPREIEGKFKNVILESTKYTTAYTVVINIVNYLKDLKMIDHLLGTKKGKYVVISDETLKQWLETNV